MRSTAASVADVLHSVARRFDAAALVGGAAVVLGLALIGGLGLATPVWGAPWEVLLSRFVEAAVAALGMFAAVAIADELVERGGARLPTYGVAVVASALAGAWLSWEVREWTGLRYPEATTALPHHELLHRFDVATVAILVGGLATFVHANRRAAIAARRRQHTAERARAAARRRTLELELQALQARVEPVFLFDSLNRILAFYRSDATAAGAMLEDLIVYLRAALPHMRESTSTVARETTLAGAWLDIVRRPWPDWHVRFSVAAEAAHLPLPALVLLPLVQYVVTVAGDSVGALAIDVDASLEGSTLCLRVASSARGTPVGRADGDGIRGVTMASEVAERLRALYGAEASLVTRFIDGGIESVVRVPAGSVA